MTDCLEAISQIQAAAFDWISSEWEWTGSQKGAGAVDLLTGHIVVPRLKPLRGFALRHASSPAKISHRAICSYL
jgi:hypothetical protein